MTYPNPFGSSPSAPREAIHRNITAGADRGPRDADPSPDLASLDRLLALTDQIIGLQAELAEARYQNDLAELELNSTGRSRRSTYRGNGDAEDLVLHARLSTEIELRQALARQLVEITTRASEGDGPPSSESVSSTARRVARFARSKARAALDRWH